MMPDPAHVRDLIWEHSRDLMFTTQSEFMRALEDWEIEGHVVDGDLIGAVLRRGPEFHYAAFVTGRLTRALIKELFRPQLEKYGYLTTRTPVDDLKQRRWNSMWGFVKTGEDEYDVYYRLEKR